MNLAVIYFLYDIFMICFNLCTPCCWIVSPTDHRPITPELKNLNPSFIYQNTPLNVLFKMLGCSSWKNLGFEHSEGDTTDFWRFALGGDTIMRGDIIQQPGVFCFCSKKERNKNQFLFNYYFKFFECLDRGWQNSRPIPSNLLKTLIIFLIKNPFRHLGIVNQLLQLIKVLVVFLIMRK